ncbi:hypothetical protein [Amycolatopsis sp. CA-128772]|uniref:hypothetical protein n=1 Tax=Amycolatopsis sp. CA-128772 TaxID=2073159 RepID=UPI000CD14EAE|nr:hypothetical protein [Amycolatopsis sp. CA-128772]
MTDGFGFPFGCAAAVAAVIVADLAGATGHPWYALVTLGAVVTTTAYRSPPPAAGVAVVAWALHAGFVLGRLGELTFDPASALAALVLTTALVTGTLTRTAVSSLRTREPTVQVRESTVQVRESTVQTREPTVQVRESAVRAREFAGRVLRVP